MEFFKYNTEEIAKISLSLSDECSRGDVFWDAGILLLAARYCVAQILVFRPAATIESKHAIIRLTFNDAPQPSCKRRGIVEAMKIFLWHPWTGQRTEVNASWHASVACLVSLFASFVVYMWKTKSLILRLNCLIRLSSLVFESLSEFIVHFGLV